MICIIVGFRKSNIFFSSVSVRCDVLCIYQLQVRSQSPNAQDTYTVVDQRLHLCLSCAKPTGQRSWSCRIYSPAVSSCTVLETSHPRVLRSIIRLQPQCLTEPRGQSQFWASSPMSSVSCQTGRCSFLPFQNSWNPVDIVLTGTMQRQTAIPYRASGHEGKSQRPVEPVPSGHGAIHGSEKGERAIIFLPDCWSVQHCQLHFSVLNASLRYSRDALHQMAGF